MEILNTVLTVLFVIVCILLIIIILLQSNRSAGMGLFGGGAQSAFGASSGDILTKLTAGLGAAFMVLALIIAMLKTQGTSIESVQQEMQKGEKIKTPIEHPPPKEAQETPPPTGNTQGAQTGGK